MLDELRAGFCGRKILASALEATFTRPRHPKDSTMNAYTGNTVRAGLEKCIYIPLGTSRSSGKRCTA